MVVPRWNARDCAPCVAAWSISVSSIPNTLTTLSINLCFNWDTCFNLLTNVRYAKPSIDIIELVNWSVKNWLCRSKFALMPITISWSALWFCTGQIIYVNPAFTRAAGGNSSVLIAGRGDASAGTNLCVCVDWVVACYKTAETCSNDFVRFDEMRIFIWRYTWIVFFTWECSLNLTTSINTLKKTFKTNPSIRSQGKTKVRRPKAKSHFL